MLHLWGADPNAVRTAQMFVGQGRGQDAWILARHGVLIVDGSDLPKQGRESVGVARQYGGELGKTANCQAEVFLGYASVRGGTLIHRRLYLPRHGVEDPAWAERRRRWSWGTWPRSPIRPGSGGGQ